MSAHLEIQDQQKPRAKQSCGRCSQCGCQRQQGMSDLAALRVAVSEAMMQLRDELISGKYRMPRDWEISMPQVLALDMAHTVEDARRHVLQMSVSGDDNGSWYMGRAVDIQMATVMDDKVPHGLAVELRVIRRSAGWDAMYSWRRQANVALNRDDAVRDLVQAIKTAPFEQAFYGTPL